MFIKYSLWKSILLFLSSLYLTIAVNNHRENLAQRHPCYSINQRLVPYIKWTEKLASTQYKIQKDACGHTGSSPACCTHEIFNSYAFILANDLKTLLDTKLDQLTQFLSLSKKKLDNRIKEYITEFHHLTISSLETLFGTKEYHLNIHHSISTLFNILGDHQSTDNDVSKSAVNLFNQLILSSYRRFMTNNNDLIFDDNFKKCLLTKAFDIDALPKQRELLYTLTSTTSLIQILRTLFIYIDADIQQLKTTVTLNSHRCLQRYVREALCPICANMPSSSSSLSSSMNYDNNINEPLCENDCHYVIKTCFNETSNPYVAFAIIAQGYATVIKQIQDSVIELKVVERLSKLHIYLYDMVVNVINTRQIYHQLQNACPNSNEKSFQPIVSLSPITSERRELVKKWNVSLHFMLDQLQSSITNLNTSLTQQITTNICSKPNYAVKSSRCTQIDQHVPENFMQWPLPPLESSLQITSNLTAQLTHNQLDELKKKMTPIQQMIISLRPRKKISLAEYIPDFEYDNEIDINDNDIQSSSLYETYDSENQGSLSEQIYKEIDGQTTRQSTTKTKDYIKQNNINHSQSMTHNITLYLFIFLVLIIHQIVFTNQ
ncbi:unnamed protein product [Rotaria sordida]|uniref:Uncharacterized protein n=1 Tax=Rotaria sordida TaxID=392033 RepID=A0A818IS67_9BILA|nr:unnamed protein product [Rotaria sordida]CAF3524602.1 unnamed protein product [Rotaria sordida]